MSLNKQKRIAVVVEFLKNFKTENTIVMVDPVMGDYGKLYSTYTQEMCDEMKKLIKYADVMTPNLTEACRLLDITYPERPLNPDQLENIAKKVRIKLLSLDCSIMGIYETLYMKPENPILL